MAALLRFQRVQWEDPPQASVWRQRKRAALLAHVQARLASVRSKRTGLPQYGQLSKIVWSCIMASAWHPVERDQLLPSACWRLKPQLGPRQRRAPRAPHLCPMRRRWGNRRVAPAGEATGHPDHSDDSGVTRRLHGTNGVTPGTGLSLYWSAESPTPKFVIPTSIQQSIASRIFPGVGGLALMLRAL